MTTSDSSQALELSEVRLFRGLTRAELEPVVAVCAHQTFLAGDELFEEGEEGDALFIVEHGRVEVIKPIRAEVDRVLGTFAEGEVIGEMSFLDGRKRSATARATVTTHVLALGRSDFDRIAVEHPKVASTFFASIAAIMADRLRITSNAYKQSVLAHMEATGAEALHLHRLVEDVRSVTLHLVGGTSVSGRLLELEHQPQGWAILLKDQRDKVSLVPYHALVRIEVVE